MTLSPTSPLEEVWVALDTETTGLDPESDRIIEVGAVKFRGDEVLGVFQSFVNPAERLSKFIRNYTGITQRDVDQAPPFPVVATDLLPFIDGAPVVGHNVGFDLGFLRSHGLPFDGPVADTYDLGRVFLPWASYHSLTGLAKELDVPVVRAHRAADDAETTRRVFVALLRIAADTDLDTLREIQSIASKSSTSALRYTLRQLVGGETVSRAQMSLEEPVVDLRELAAMRREAESERSEGNPSGFDGERLRKRLGYYKALPPGEDDKPVDVDEVAEQIGADGPLASVLPGFEHRTEQVEMARSVAEAINEGQRFIVEAGTGVGKSLAYLLPAALYALENGRRVVVSTNTINLQEQLIAKDIPTLVDALSISYPGGAQELKYSLLKGRANYLCMRRWTHTKNGESLSEEDVRLLSGILVWLDRTSTGDRNELNVGRRSLSNWNRVSAQGALKCRGQDGVCFLRSSRARAEASHIVVVNHALLLTDIVAGGTIIPEYDVLIVDEAHHLELVATKHLGFEVSRTAVGEHLQEVLGERGLIGRAMTALQRMSGIERARRVQEDVGQLAPGLLPALREGTEALFGLLEDRVGGDSRADRQMRITESIRRQPFWSDVETVWENVNLSLVSLANCLDALISILQDLEPDDANGNEGLIIELSGSALSNAEIRQNFEEFAVRPKEEGVYWVEKSGRGDDVAFFGAPLHVGELLEEHLYSRKSAVVMTSATLAAAGTFDHIRERTGFVNSEHRLLGSPFDYASSALVCVPNDMPEPSAPTYLDAAAQAIGDAAVAAGGRTMALFTSYASLRSTAEEIRASMKSQGIELLVQGNDGSPDQIIRRFRENPQSIILGTASFWEGIDLAGDSLQALVVMRLPFNVPTEPVFEARSELYDNAFMEFAVPQAALRLRQGFGRLIRTKTDRGVAIILDRRVISRRYGSLFLRSLPPASQTTCRLDELGDEVRQWLGR
ncbi:MAG: exonuclease domain-containing protein [Chloroflexi bacterium]|nr:exonuclease domain-containing protein [Chloroflexota bacterium]